MVSTNAARFVYSENEARSLLVSSATKLTASFLTLKYSTDQPRDESGKFASAGGSSSSQAKAVPTDPAYWSNAKQVGGQLGSNKGGVFQGPDGDKYYVKFYANPKQAYTEVASQYVYRSLGVEVPRGGVATIDGKTAVANRWVEGNKILSSPELRMALAKDPAYAAKVFVASVMTQNWDVVGQNNDNLVMTTGGKLMVVDTGGSFTFRAQGGAKPYTTNAKEFDTFQNPQVNSHTTNAFKGLFTHPVAVSAAIKATEDMRNHAAVLARAPGITPSEFRAKADDLIGKLKALNP